jgi:hypothetical protein
MSEVLIKDNTIIDFEVQDVIAHEFKRSSISTWQKTLMVIVADATECKSYYHRISRLVEKRSGYGYTRSYTWELHFYGTEWDVAVAKELFVYLHATALKMSRRLYEGDLVAQNSFLQGFCNGLWRRVKAKIKENQTKVEGNEKFALMVVSKENALERFGEKIGLQPSKSKGGRKYGGKLDMFAYLKGQVEADKVDLNTDDKLNNGVQPVKGELT